MRIAVTIAMACIAGLALGFAIIALGVHFHHAAAEQQEQPPAFPFYVVEHGRVGLVTHVGPSGYTAVFGDARNHVTLVHRSWAEVFGGR